MLEVPEATGEVDIGGGVGGPASGKDTALEARHGEEEVGVVLGVHRDEGALPVDGGDGARQAVLDVPEDGPAQVHVVLHETHAGITGPALLVVVTDNVLVVGVGVFGEVALDQVTSLLSGETKEHPETIGVSRVQADGVGHFGRRVLGSWRKEMETNTRRIISAITSKHLGAPSPA